MAAPHSRLSNLSDPDNCDPTTAERKLVREILGMNPGNCRQQLADVKLAIGILNLKFRIDQDHGNTDEGGAMQQFQNLTPDESKMWNNLNNSPDWLDLMQKCDYGSAYNNNKCWTIKQMICFSLLSALRFF